MRQVIILLLLSISLPLSAEQNVDYLQRLQLQVEQSYRQDAQQRNERERDFLKASNRQKQLLAEAREQLARERGRSDGLQQSFKANEKKVSELERELQQRTGNLGELFGSVRQAGKDLSGLLQESPVSVQYPGRAAWLAQIGERKALPDMAELEKLWLTVQQEIVESGRVVRFPAQIVGEDGVSSQRDVVRAGLFASVAGRDYLRYQPQAERFVVLSRQPEDDDRDLAEELAAVSEGFADLALDPTRGVLLGLLVEMPDLAERIQQGGAVGYVIIVLAIAGILIGVARLGYLTIISTRVKVQLANPDQPSMNNPLGRILTVAVEDSRADVQNLELHLDEAILRETPRLVRGENLLKLLAGVAPLLGLLGTVVGMIITFQSISLFGTGDPKLMASGISQALITTAQGLIAAVPLLFLHNLVASRSRALVQLLEQQTAGIIAMSREQG